MSENLIDSLYPFVKINSQNNPSFRRLREQEILLNNRLRAAVTSCKNNLGIKTNNLGHISEEEKLSIETCLQNNYLKGDQDYFGKRDSIFIDLNNYN